VGCRRGVKWVKMYCLISDIHANLEALEAVLAAARKAGAEKILCMGDLVGYGPDPNECAYRIRETADAVVAGNHDLAAIGRLDLSWFNHTARRAIQWTAARLKPEISAYIASLPLTQKLDGLLMVHGSPRDPAEEYLRDTVAAASSFESAGFHLCLTGHTHRPLVFAMDTDGDVSMMEPAADTLLELEESYRYIVNAGSVGQPRNLDAAAAWCLYDRREGIIAFRSSRYAVAKTQARMRSAGLPQSLIGRLAEGM